MARVALVTGGTRGIGEAISIALKDAGYIVAAVYAGNDERAKAFTDKTAIKTYKFDVSDFEQCQEGVSKIETDLGPVEVLVNNAGITRDATLHKMTPKQWGDVIQTDLTSCFNMCRAVIEGMRSREFGRIINISSMNGELGGFGQANYSAAKAGIIGFSKAVAREDASKGITVNVITPGFIATEMVLSIPEKVMSNIVNGIPTKRLGQPSEIARGVVFLASDDAGYITGSTLDINGAGCDGSSEEQQTTLTNAQASAAVSTRTVGVITGFGSVFVNGIEYETDVTQIEIDENLDGLEDDLEVGMVVSLSGNINPDGSSGQALRIHYSESVKGMLESIDLIASTLTVLGQTVHYDELTNLDKLVLEELVAGDILEISGFTNADGELYATRIEKEDAITDLKIKGTISNLDESSQTFSLNALTVNYGSASIEGGGSDPLTNGHKVKVKGAVENLVDDVFTVSSLKILKDDDDEKHQKQVGDRQELEGFIDSWVSTSEFTVAGTPVLTTPDTEIKYGSIEALVLNARIKLKGHYDAEGNIVADTIRIHQRSRLKFAGAIQAIDSEQSTITVMGVTLQVTEHTKMKDDSKRGVRYFSIQDLAIADEVEIKGFIDKDGNTVATRLEREGASGEEPDDAKLRGLASDISATGFTIMGVQIETTQDTKFEAPNGDEVTQSEFFAAVQSGMLLEVEGTLIDGVFQAYEVEVKGEEEYVDDNGLKRTELKGRVELISESGFIVADHPVAVNESTKFEYNDRELDSAAFFELLEVGHFVKVKGEISESKVIIAREVEYYRKPLR
ncbi:unnamed protein product [Cyprideis torosa]|uniref:3-oxoacyl-[acyl-carrier-protein] reductase n=1 Tax=Cyprideis torosa TaxID=163714 RepID=A0A7R8W4L7_9CRUS|nr:unnamed protein product [Cyprideis torosa]CAG0882013.1 unnamed protein product [Cyprideis torosa]